MWITWLIPKNVVNLCLSLKKPKKQNETKKKQQKRERKETKFWCIKIMVQKKAATSNHCHILQLIARTDTKKKEKKR